MRYFAAYTHLFKSPKWMTLVGVGVLSTLVPVVGGLVFSGYLYEHEADMRQTGDEQPRDFDFNRLLHYLMRGVWPFLVQLIIGLVANVILMPIVFAILFGCVAAFGMPEGMLIGELIIFPVSLLFGCLLQVIIIPLALRAAYNLDFASGFDTAYLKDFLRRVGKEAVLAQLFLAGTAIVLVLVGLLMCFVGVYLVVPLMQFAQIHLVYQLHKLYEERGGEPLTFKPYEGGGSRTPPPPGWRDEREGVFRPDEPPPPPSTGIQGKETGFQE
jgi:hypothetical protein